jgi:hypothetical protein
MDEILNRILTKLELMDGKIEGISRELKEFREAQEATNKLLIGDSAGVKNQLRDVRDDFEVRVTH